MMGQVIQAVWQINIESISVIGRVRNDGSGDPGSVAN